LGEIVNTTGIRGQHVTKIVIGPGPAPSTDIPGFAPTTMTFEDIFIPEFIQKFVVLPQIIEIIRENVSQAYLLVMREEHTGKDISIGFNAQIESSSTTTPIKSASCFIRCYLCIQGYKNE
jgi:hypothetical protein